MPFIPHTPESLLPRSDSKNPAATCSGLTSNGRPCRRALSRSPQSSPSPSPRRLASPEAYCWQHQEQASTHNTPTPSPQRKHDTIQERTSVDTLVDRLGLLEVEQKKGHGKRQYRPRNRIPGEKPSNGLNPSNNTDHDKPSQRRPAQPKQRSTLYLLCCIGEEDHSREAPRPARKPAKHTSSYAPQGQGKTSRPPIVRDPSSRTGEFLSLIPSSTSPQTTALLLSELAKPFSVSDGDGFIYMFWLTPESLPADAPAQAASTLLAPPARLPPGQRRTSDVLNTFAAATPDTSSKKTMLLKIGRAQNVQRRLNQWTRQCGYNVSLIRYYPYHSTTGSSSNVNTPPRTPTKVPNVNKVERLIHLELAGQKAKGDAKCSTCGREHREWFEVDASRNGVAAVDEVIRRWVGWGEREAAR
jgi:hypothetical protein